MEDTTHAQEKLLYKNVKKVALSELLKNKPPKGKTHAILEQPSNDILSFCSEDYYLRKNSTIFKPFEKLLTEKNIPFKKVIRVIEANKFYVDFIILVKLQSETMDSLLPRLVISNSYDGTVKTQIQFGYFNMLCSNMLSRPSSCIIKNSTKHSTEDEFSPIFLYELFQQFMKATKCDIKIFEKLAKKKTRIESINEISEVANISRDARDIAKVQLQKKIGGNMTYTNETGQLVKSRVGSITYFSLYNALNYAIYNTNNKELPDFKIKRDKVLIESVRKIAGVL